MKKTNIIAGACFGYFDSNFEECKCCRITASCYTATKSDKVEEVRGIGKIANAQVDKLVKEWKPKDPIPLDIPEGKQLELSPESFSKNVLNE